LKKKRIVTSLYRTKSLPGSASVLFTSLLLFCLLSSAPFCYACDVTIDTSPQGVLIRDINYDSVDGNPQSCVDLNVSPLSNATVECGWHRITIGEDCLQRSLCELDIVTDIFLLNIYNPSIALGNYVLKGNYYNSSFGRHGGSGVKFQFNSPQGIHADIKDGTGWLFVADPANKNVHLIKYNGGYLSEFETGFLPINCDGCVVQLAYDVVADINSIFIVGLDFYNYPVIAKFNRSTRKFQKHLQLGMYCHALTVDESGNIYVVHRDDNLVTKWDNDLNFLASFGETGSADRQFKSPQDIAVDPDGAIYIADTGNHRIQILDANLNFIQSIKGLMDRRGRFDIYSYYDNTGLELVSPVALTIDKFRPGVIYILSREQDMFPRNVIYTIDTLADYTGARVISFHIGQDGDPRGITIDNSNKLYVSNSETSQIDIFTPSTSALGAISGNVSNKYTSEPIRNALVTLKKNTWSVSKDTFLTRTDGSGNFAIPDLVAGTYTRALIEADCSPSVSFTDIVVQNGTTTNLGNIVLDRKPPVWIAGSSYYYNTIHEAYSGGHVTNDGQSIRMQEVEITDTLTFNGHAIRLQGGYDCNYSPQAGAFTTVHGRLTFSGGAVTVDKVIVK
jgi:hypothetical protein